VAAAGPKQSSNVCNVSPLSKLLLAIERQSSRERLGPDDGVRLPIAGVRRHL
jgi:hypothetical protein